MLFSLVFHMLTSTVLPNQLSLLVQTLNNSMKIKVKVLGHKKKQTVKQVVSLGTL